ncbi:hypothetical protein [Mycobacterium sp. 852014-52144_SCH5372336]|uniref:hypothetical protein n=1 Tax=Mycobacterium sp. 852014-52144_SCH5372336 TaxID=1834115 RepID=UPI0007FE1B53|nr:hypothetical protein [Mycobacterium sp. 852014-52144_SCH5372336]OBB73216.1 hypothetical protein A5759_16605 [Mycobacterium sp. 852014-52144_SCH5372336]
MNNRYQKWSVDETILITDWVKNRGGQLPDQNSAEVAALRDSLFPQRSIDSVYLQAWHAQCALGYADDNGSRSRQILAVGVLFQTDEAEMSAKAGEIRLRRRGDDKSAG